MATPQTLSGLKANHYKGAKKLKISSGLTTFPPEILTLAPTLEILDLSGNTALSSLPASISKLQNLKIAFFSNCSFITFPSELAQCRNLEMVAFKSNGLRKIPEDALPRKLRWLILTGNEIEVLPRSIGNCARLEKCMLAGNKLTSLPDEMRFCRKLGLLRLSCNRFTSLPGWLWELPELAFLSWAGNNGVDIDGSEDQEDGVVAEKASELEEVKWEDLEVKELLGEGASGIISKGVWTRRTPSSSSQLANGDIPTHAPPNLNSVSTTSTTEIAIKIFHSGLTSDGSPHCEMRATLAAGKHTNLISPLGTITSHPSSRRGLLLELIPPTYINLGLPPNFTTCTRDNFSPALFLPGTKTKLSISTCREILLGIALAAEHLHSKGIAHGDLYAHNILFNPLSGHALLGDFGAATVYSAESKDAGFLAGAGGDGKAERLEVLAFGHLIEDLVGLVTFGEGEGLGEQEGEEELEQRSEKDAMVLEAWRSLHWRCTDPVVGRRPGFGEVREVLEEF